ncbi:MAG: flagellar basal body-associated FliL family protein [Actinobacteria bacterium]|nr:flagellar basal body-associated FliL family protein [Actinomycetota bacterium]
MDTCSFSNKGKILIAVAVAMILILLGSGCSKEEDAGEVIPGVEEFGPVLDLGEMIVNLSDEGQARYAKMVVVMEFDGEEGLAEATRRDPQIRDIVIELLSSEKAANILSLEGRSDLKKRIKERINSVMSVGSVKKIYFTTVVVQ